MHETSPAARMPASPEESRSVLMAAYQEAESLSILLPRLTTAVWIVTRHAMPSQ